MDSLPDIEVDGGDDELNLDDDDDDAAPPVAAAKSPAASGISSLAKAMDERNLQAKEAERKEAEKKASEARLAELKAAAPGAKYEFSVLPQPHSVFRPEADVTFDESGLDIDLGADSDDDELCEPWLTS